MGRISRSYPKGKLKLHAPKKAQPDKKYQIYIEYNWQADNARKSTGISVFAKEWNDRFKGKMPQVLKTLYQNRGIIKYLLSNPDEALIQDVEDQWGENESQSLCLDKWFGLMQQVFDENNELKDIDLKELFVLWQ